MSATEPSPRQAQFTLSAPPPVRALAIGAGVSVVGVVLLVLWAELGWPVGLVVLAVVVLVLGVALVVTALVLTARSRTVVQTDAEQIEVVRGGRRSSARWSEVGEVSVVGHRLTLRDKEGQGAVTVLNPRARADPAFLALMTDIQQRLDSDRGYQPFG